MKTGLILNFSSAASVVIGVTVLAAGLASCGDGPTPPPPASPVISLSRSSVSLTQEIGSPASSESFDVTNSGGGTLSWSVAADQSWVSTSPLTGSLGAGAGATVNVTTSGALLGTGAYQAGIAVSGNAGNSPQSVSAALTVTQSAPLVLTDGTPVSGLGGGASSEILFRYDLPGGSGSVSPAEGGGSLASARQDEARQGGALTTSLAVSQAAVASLLRITLGGGSGNADLYVRQGTPPTTTTFECASTSSDNDEVCELLNPVGGSWFVLVRGAGSFDGATASLQFLDDVEPASIQLAPASLVVEAAEGSDAADDTLTITNPGDLTLTWTADADEEWVTLEPSSGSVAPGASVEVTVSLASSDFESGEYAATITVSDPSASATPQSAIIQLTVAPAAVIQLGQTALNFDVLEGSNPANQTFTITNAGGLTLDWTATEQRSWMELQPVFGSLAPGASVDVAVSVLSSGLDPNTYTGTITVADPSASNSPQTIAVSLTVAPVPTIELDPETLDFATDEGLDPADQTFEVRNTGEAELNWTAAAVEFWISLDPDSGSVPVGGSETVTVSISTSGLEAGSYTGEISVGDPNASNSPQTVGVTLAIIPAGFRQLRVAGSGSGAGNVTSSPAGIDCDLSGEGSAGTCSGFFEEDSDVTLTATSEAGNEFTEWSGDCSGSGTCVVTMDQNRFATAEFEDPVMDIVIRFTAGSTPTESQEQAFADAEARWEEIITLGLPDMPLSVPAGQCGNNAPPIDETIDDLLILATVTNIDGPGGILGQAGPCFLRSDSRLPILGLMRFDSNDLEALEFEGSQKLKEVIIHEMGHVLGIGVIWDDLRLLQQPSRGGGLDPHFTGPEAIASFDAVGGGFYMDNKVPVENFGGAGTADSHWRESVMNEELMTGFIDFPPNPLSQVTISSLADIGYQVDVTQADRYQIVLNLRASRATPPIQLKDDVWRGQIYVADRDGTVRRIEDVEPEFEE